MKLFAVLFLLSGLAFGQDLKSVIPKYPTGATLSYRVEFAGDPKFTTVTVSFFRQSPPVSPNDDQPGLPTTFELNHSVKVKSGVYDVGGQIPKTLRSGDYILQEIDASIDQASKGYSVASMNILIHVDNDAKYDFPPLKSVKPN